MRIFDLSPEITEEIAVFPGDTPFAFRKLIDMNAGDNLTVGFMTSTTHLGSHVDAPSHYSAAGVGIGERSLDYYVGPCQVVSVTKTREGRIYPEHLPEITSSRVLIRTQSFENPNLWDSTFWALSPELVEFLASKKVVLVGIDTPSIDPAEDKELLSHGAIAENNMAILEGITLKSVADGKYFLSAAPLKMKDADASPVRALLIEGIL